MKSKVLSTMAIAAFALLFSACSNADIRPDSIKGGVSEQARVRGRALLDAVVQRAGGARNWRAVRSANMIMRDDWRNAPAIFRWLLNVWETENQSSEFAIDTRNFGNASARFLDGPNRGHVWGLHNGRSYATRPDSAGKDGARSFQENADRKLFLDSIDYYFGFTFRIVKADQVAYVDRKKLHNKEYDRVMLSWKTFAPQNDFDQFLLYIGVESGDIEYVTCSVRAKAGFIEASYRFSEYRLVQGLRIAHRVDAMSDVNDKPGHSIYYERARLRKTAVVVTAK